ncbi:CoA transferase [Pusillimonas sp. MFBS29]|uniref:CaiB/BaiF CoA transferase family protein n=1 Tax=Pusillimonas sp. MFBS29 TaxID=2886690 RepID=UPI001D109E2E|nr:CoA transferase [Pusillimonas sp. MFBS29]
MSGQPLSGCRVLERSRTAASAYAGRLLAAMGATVIMLEPSGGSRLRRAAPFVEETGESALFAYLSVGKRSIVCDTDTAEGQELLQQELREADILIDDTPVKSRAAHGVDPEVVKQINDRLIHVSVLPFGATGPKADWDGEEINLLHAGGEGYLLPNGLSTELFPDRPPLKIYGNFGSYQAGCMAALGALSAWWVVDQVGGQYVDVSVQDAVLAVGAFALQRLGDGSLEHRLQRSFKYGGVFETQDGYIELLTLEDRQWASLVQLLGAPAWATEPEFSDPLERSKRGAEINEKIRGWMRQHPSDEIVDKAQQLGVPVGKYRPPAEVVQGEHERARQLFAAGTLAGGQSALFLKAPFQFRCTPLQGGGQVPELNELAQEASS